MLPQFWWSSEVAEGEQRNRSWCYSVYESMYLVGSAFRVGSSVFFWFDSTIKEQRVGMRTSYIVRCMYTYVAVYTETSAGYSLSV